ncbi:hypothetical protein [Streptomyces sp. T12]|uniref:hypothetical protein n=1 Tax=unclassified Streptomyces TaxID=2593676 RepID=UPI0027D325DE|nr:hypothetical protein [Streptomyces sp. T12]
MTRIGPRHRGPCGGQRLLPGLRHRGDAGEIRADVSRDLQQRQILLDEPLDRGLGRVAVDVEGRDDPAGAVPQRGGDGPDAGCRLFVGELDTSERPK